MPIRRTFQEKNNVLIFDTELDERLSSYNADHLDVLAEAEKGHFWFQNRCEKICQIFNHYVRKTDRVLEIGMGTGFVAEKLKELGYAVEVSDIYSKGLQYAKKRGLERLYQFDLFNPPFEEEFDVICLFDVLEHLSEDQRALECLKKMLRPGGLIILTVPAHPWLWSRDDVIAGHHQRFTKASLKKKFLSSGLSPRHLRYFFSAILPLLFLRTWIKKDSKLPLGKGDRLEIKMHPLLNKALHLATKSEFYLDRLLPNIAGGSLIAIAQKS
jgi:2-polyprenyl-3-methyl-5-hydroxy-6-metoxy-1,4-benzoquinol methylase